MCQALIYTLQYLPLALKSQEEHMKGVESIIDEASLFEDADAVKVQQAMRHQTFIELNKISEHDV